MVIPKPIKSFIAERPWLNRLFIGLKQWLRERPTLFRYVVILSTTNPKTLPKTIYKQTIENCRSYIQGIKAKKSSKHIQALYRKALLTCIQNKTPNWWEQEGIQDFESVLQLQNLLKNSVLRAAGDYTTFITLSRELETIIGNLPKHFVFARTLAEHYESVIDSIEKGELAKGLHLDSDKRPLVIGVSVWGDRYLNLFLDHCLPSLMTAGNLEALCAQRQPILFIHTTEADKQRFEQEDKIKQIKAMGVVVHYRILDATLLAHIPEYPDNIFWHLGMVQSIDLYFAKSLQADYHLLMPDTIYANNVFADTLAAVSQGHQTVTRFCLSTRMEGILPAIESYRQDGVISIPAEDLKTLAIQHLHEFFHSLMLTNRDLVNEMPGLPMLIWESKDHLHLNSPHHTVVYLDRDILQLLPTRYFLSLDSELDKIIPQDTKAHCPSANDGIILIEVSPENARSSIPARVPIKEFSRIFWASAPSINYWNTFTHTIVDPLNRDALSDREYMSEADIDNARKYVQDAVLDYRSAMTEEQKHTILTVLEKIKDHPDAHHAQQQITDILSEIAPNNTKQCA